MPELVRVDWADAAQNGTEEHASAAALAALDGDGFVVLEHALPAADCDALVAEMQPYLDATPRKRTNTRHHCSLLTEPSDRWCAVTDGLHGLGGTRRCGALVARSPTSHKMVMHPAILKLVNSVLGEQQVRMQYLVLTRFFVAISICGRVFSFSPGSLTKLSH